MNFLVFVNLLVQYTGRLQMGRRHDDSARLEKSVNAWTPVDPASILAYGDLHSRGRRY